MRLASPALHRTLSPFKLCLHLPSVLPKDHRLTQPSSLCSQRNLMKRWVVTEQPWDFWAAFSWNSSLCHFPLNTSQETCSDSRPFERSPSPPRKGKYVADSNRAFLLSLPCGHGTEGTMYRSTMNKREVGGSNNRPEPQGDRKTITCKEGQCLSEGQQPGSCC